ncbi:MAG: permease, partial [Candidatus Riflebacteria bacterium]|nr:permease [Candidatus Riflebacteria bacterium]
LAVCSCSVLPMFAGIYTMGAGLGPASAFLYSGPAINVMAVFLSARVLGFDLGVARAVGSIVFAVVIGLAMAWFFRHEEQRRVAAQMQMPPPPASPRSLLQTTTYFACLVLFLVFSDWYNTNDVTLRLRDGSAFTANVRYQTAEMLDVQVYQPDGLLSPEVKRLVRADVLERAPVPSLAMTIHGIKWYLAGLMGLAILVMLTPWFTRDEVSQWMAATWDFGKTIVPLLFGGVFVTGFVSALIPERAVAGVVGDNGLVSNLIASVVGMCWYFATLTEIPITQALMKLGMAKGPALALLLAGPALSIPSILVLLKIMGGKKTAVFCALTVVMSTIVGVLFGAATSP